MYLPEEHFQLATDSTLLRCAQQYHSFLECLDETDGFLEIKEVQDIKEQLEAIQNELRRRGLEANTLARDSSV